VEQFQTGTLALIAALPATTGVFSSTCLSHCLSGQPIFTELKVLGESMSSALSAWYFGTGTARVVSPCTGWACTAACGVNTATGQPCNGGTVDCRPLRLAVDASEGSVPPVAPAPGWPPTPPAAPPSPPVDIAGVAATEASLSPSQLKALRQAQCNAAALTAQAAAHVEQRADGAAAALAQAASQATLATCLTEAADSSTARRLLSAVPSCCYGRGDA
jgi:hypothetical protein